MLAWEEEPLVDIRNLLSNVTLQKSDADVWLWRLNISDGYTVRGVYRILMRQEMHDHAWCLFCNRWPTKDKLVRRGVITVDNQLCVS